MATAAAAPVRVDDTPFEDEEEVNTVFKAIQTKASKYAEIGRGFGLAPDTIDSIRENHPKDNSGALQDVIKTWIQQDFNTDKFSLPSWQKVHEVISGFDKLLAKKIAKAHPATGAAPEQMHQQQSEPKAHPAIGATPEQTHQQQKQQPEPTTPSSNVEIRPQEEEEEEEGEYMGSSLLSNAGVQEKEPSDVATDGGKKVVPVEELKPLDRRRQTEPLEFKFGRVQPKVGETKASTLSDAYEMKPGCHGLAIIINNETFRSHDRRRGTTIDEENLKVVLPFLGYKVRIYRDVDSYGMTAIFREIQKVNHTPYDSFVCCILSHGDKDDVYGSDSVRVNIADLTEKLNGDKCRKLVGKPKLFFIQACRGDKQQKRVAADGESLPNTSDFFFSFSVPRGYEAYHHTREGSWYITELCRALGEHATHAPLIEIMHLAHQRVAEKYAKQDKKDIVQSPELVYRLQKHVYFF